MQPTHKQNLDLVCPNESEYEHVAAFPCQGLFSRLRVRQELAKPRRLFLMFDRKFKLWDWFDTAFTFATERGIPIYPTTGLEALSVLRKLRIATQVQWPWSLLYLFSMAQALDCHDKRGIVYNSRSPISGSYPLQAILWNKSTKILQSPC
jgi:hypothetical protein